MDSLDKLWEDLQNRASSVLDKSHVLLKYVALVAITFFAFSLRLVGFIRVRGSNELEDIFNLAMTDKLSSSGLATFFHEQSSVPEGSVLYPGLAAFINATQCLLGHAGVVFSVQTLYTLAGPFFAACSAVATYFLGKELRDEVTGLVAAGILSLLPGFFALSVDGRNSNVVGGTFFAILVVLAFVRAVKSQSPLQAFFAGFAYFCLSSFWSGHVFIQLLLSTYVVVLLCLDKCSASVHTAYSVFFIVSNVLNILLPAGGFFPFLNAEFYLGFGVFVLLQLGTYVKLQGSLLPAAGLAFAVIIGVASMVFGLKSSPAFSVFWAQFAAGNGSSWLTFFRDLHLVLFLFPAGVFLCFRKKSNVNVFFTVYAALALFVSSVSANFVAVLFPVAAVLASLGLTSTVKTYLRNQEAPVKKASSKPISKEINVAALAGMAAVAGFFLVYSFSAATHPTLYQQTTVFPAVSQTNNEFLKVDDLREAVSWLQHNTPNDTQVVTWRGLGQQVANIARLSILGTDSSRPQNLAQAAQVFQADEKTAAAKVAELGAQYVLVVFGGATGFSSDDLARSHEISSEGHFSEESLLFKLAYKGFADLPTRPSDHPGFDLARQHAVSFRPELSHFVEVFTSEHWLVRIFELSPPSLDTEAEETTDGRDEL